jgi:hypothetical protein
MREILLTRGMEAIVDDGDYEWLSQWRWHAMRCKNKFYAARKPREKVIFMHRLILGAKPNEQVDHIHGNTLDNRRSEIRLATSLQNRWNRPKPRNNKSGFIGVSWDKWNSSWKCQIRIGGQSKHLGAFKSAIEAARAYDDACRAIRGEFAVVNFACASSTS